MAKVSGMTTRHGEADTIGATGAKRSPTARRLTPTDLGSDEMAAALTRLLADFFALYIKTKNFHWHVSGPHFRDYHLLLDEQASQIYEATDLIAERTRKLGGMAIRPIRHVARLQRLSDNDAEFVAPPDMLAELRDDNSQLTIFMREAHIVPVGLLLRPRFANLSFAPLAAFEAANLVPGETFYDLHVVSASGGQIVNSVALYLMWLCFTLCGSSSICVEPARSLEDKVVDIVM
jgi:starvation-inducible DNA-binding protein